MAEPEIGARIPAILELEAGTYWWCRCGRSQNQPWCDGSHEGTEFLPMKFENDETRTVALCQCKRTDRGPFCDGAHAKLGGA